MNGAELLVAALENEGVEQIFGIPGEENLDVVEALRRSKIRLVLTRHEQAAAFMAATHGRLTGRPGVCITTLGPGALNLTTGAAYALLGAMPMVMITGQKGILSRKQAGFQVVDIVAAMTPLTKMADQIVSAATIPTMVREAFRVAQLERPGPVHLELPEDIAHAAAPDMAPIPPHPIDLPIASSVALDRAAELMILGAERPLIMLGAAASRPRLAAALSEFVSRVQIPFFNTQMGKGAVTGGSDLYMGTAALSERDYVHRAIDRADLIIAIGHDTVEKPPFFMGPGGPTVLHVGYLPAIVEEVYFPQAELVGDVGPSLTLLADRLEHGCRGPRRFFPCAPTFSPISPTGRRKAAIPQRPSGSSTTCAGRCRRTGSSASTTACTRSGSPATTAPMSPTRFCSTMRSPPWALACPRRSWPPVSIRIAGCSPSAATAAS